MDRDYSLGRRYSFNASLNSPAAESTKLNHSNANRSYLGSSFMWGSSPISPKQRSNSSVNLINLHSVVGRDNADSSKHMKIDPRIVADVQSKGLASRIVKYHENGNRLNRSMSAHNLYSKPGQFPVVTLKKTDLPYRATKQNVSMTRIAPPEKSAFYGSTLSSLLRSNSIVGLHKSDEDISRENRPILHPPPTENDMAPTRSVLDVLKEISRKRINSEDPEVVETSKKNRLGSDIVDVGAVTMSAQSFKRQRDLNSSYKGDVGSPSKFQETRYSPEQAKKRVCNYNNDITSSLSSSAKRKPAVNKRPSYQLNHTMPISLESYERPRGKTPKCDVRTDSTDIRFDKLADTLDSGHVCIVIGTDKTIPDDTAHGTAPSRSKSEPVPINSAKAKLSSTTTKPRLTLFNKDYDVTNGDCEHVEADDGNEDETGECAGIQFVKPKKFKSAGLKNPVIERAQKSKLALMLSGLRGELFHGSDDDEIDSAVHQTDKSKNNETKVDQVKQGAGVCAVTTQSVAGVSTTKSTATVGVTHSVSSSSTSAFNGNSLANPAPVISKLPDKTQTTDNKPQFSIKPATAKSSPLVGLKLTPSTSAENSTTTQKLVNTLSVSTPTLQGFPSNISSSVAQPVCSSTTSFNATIPSSVSSFGTTTSFSTAITQQSSANNVTAAVNSNLSTEVAKTGINATSISAISFGAINTAAGNAMPSSSFSFTPNNIVKTNPINNSSSSVLANAATPTTSTTSVATSAASNTAISSNLMNSNSFSFGNKTATPQPPLFGMKPTTTTSTATSTATFSFGTPSNLPAATSISAVKPSGGFSLASGTPASTNSQFSLGASVTTSATANTFSFGSSTNKETSMVFNAVAPKPAPTFAPPATASKPSFGISSSSNPTPVFGSTSSTSGSNMFGSTSGQTQSIFGTASPKSGFGSDGAKTSASVFGGSSSNNNALPSISFGQKPVDKAVSANNASAATGGFSFGSSSTQPAPATGAFTFDGANNSSANKNTPNSSSTPATTAPQNNAFTFGAGAKPALDNKNMSNIFGGSLPSTGNSAPTTGGFSFGATAAAAPVQKAPPTFNFGSSNASAAGANSSLASSSGFSFGAMSQPKASEGASKTFSFGTANANNAQIPVPSNPAAPHMFNNNMMNKSAATAFNFGAMAAGPTAQANVMPAAGNNIFAPPTNLGTGAGDRPIRRATRRLQK